VGQEYHVRLRNQVISKSLRRYSRQASTDQSTIFNEDTGDHIATLDEENIEVVPAVGSNLQKVVAQFNQNITRDMSPAQEDQRKEMLK
jgi:hypothetical protein